MMRSRLAGAAAIGLTLAIGCSDPPPAAPRAGGSAYEPTRPNDAPPPGKAPPGMVWIPGGEFSMGSLESGSVCSAPKCDAAPIHRVHVDGFWMDATEVTNEEYARFVASTGYVTVGEKPPRAEDYPTAPAENLVAGSLVFSPPPEPVPLDDHYRWWNYVKGASWRHPTGPGSTIAGRERYPVVQVAYEDAVAYATWAGKRLPTESEWEFAARGGEAGRLYPWGNDLRPGGKWMANIHQGPFPLADEGQDGFIGLAPVAQFPANAYGLYDVAGNVWEWCSDWYRPDAYASRSDSAVAARNPQGPDTPFDPSEPTEKKRVHRGGSYLCTDQYCTRYMVGTRGKGEVTTGSNHLGFRCVKDR
jgi:sulfatase modifying factor 1